uniref:Leukotriene A4 hydrolase n=1 Tax=Neolamprologus brichardi TaxID=32507 RepID=A0A3Q4N1E0_NEOBR
MRAQRVPVDYRPRSARLSSLSAVTGLNVMSDPCSFSSFTRCVTKHLNLHLHLDFDRHVIRGRVALTVEALEDRFSTLTLDSSDLSVVSVTANGQPVTLPSSLSVLMVTYETSPSATALQWLTPEQTAGKKHPYLFSQCQAHHCRSMIPCQDTPSIKHTYYAQVSVPKDLVAVMSAVRDGQEVDPQDSGRIIYRFRQTVPMPSYLIAIVAGALESREIGPRTRVWSEKEFVDKAAFEFSETEAMLKTAEELAGPYVWGQYDVLVLPPSFPYGGMENPCLTFATPTVLVIAHEISHSWTGNLVTNKTWEHFWLNEGHTVYLERMIGRCLESEQFRQFKAIGGWKDLQDSVNTFGANNPLTNLVPSLQDVSPDDAFSSVPYEKGFALLYYLEEQLGGPEVFMGFVKSYIQRFAYSSVTTEEWKNYLFAYFKDKVRNNWTLRQSYSDWREGTSAWQVLVRGQIVTRKDKYLQSDQAETPDVIDRWVQREVFNFEKFRDEALRVFLAHRAGMHPVTSGLVSKDLKVDVSNAASQ